MRVRPPARMVTGALLVAAVAGGGAVTPSAGAAKHTAAKPAQELARLLSSHKVYSSVRPHHLVQVTKVRAWRPITGGQTVLPVTGHTTTKDGVRWLRVMLPGRPNGSRGWIAKRATKRTTTPWHVVVRTASRRALVYRYNAVVKSFRVVVGKPSTPTPHGQFFIEESVLMPRGAPGGPFALALSARSNVLQEFEGGPGQIALHGIANLGGTMGTAASHGCVRLENRSITWLVSRVPVGARVTIAS